KMTRAVQDIHVGDRPLAGSEQLQIVSITVPGSLPAKANLVQLIRADTRKLQTRLDGMGGKAGIVLQSADALFGHGKKQFAIVHDACGGVMHLRIVDAQSNHSRFPPSPLPTARSVFRAETVRTL